MTLTHGRFSPAVWQRQLGDSWVAAVRYRPVSSTGSMTPGEGAILRCAQGCRTPDDLFTTFQRTMGIGRPFSRGGPAAVKGAHPTEGSRSNSASQASPWHPAAARSSGVLLLM
jgi:hypothetical protein